MPKRFSSGPMALIAMIAMASLVLAVGPVAASMVEGAGTHFEITDSEYLNITLDSSEPITVLLESVPRAITLHLEAAEGAAETQLTFSGLEPDSEYHLYQDDYHDHTPFTADADGSYSYLQDLTSPHLVMIQPYPSTIFVSNSGWSRAGIGTWDPATKTAALTTDVSETIQVDDSGITLDGHGHSSATTTATRAVFVKGNATGVVVRNLTISGYSYGVDTGNNCSALTLSGNWISDCTKGISLFKCDHSIITFNTVSSCGTGIAIQTDRFAIGNAVYCNSFLGNSQQASVSGTGAVFQFSLPAPIGGNYWSDWTSPDANHDGFVDVPYSFPDGTDYLPWTLQNGWDTQPPTTTASLSGIGSNGWYRSDVTATLTATDSGSGVRFTEDRLDGGSWATYTGPLSITTQGSHTLGYRSTDNAGNVEGERSQLVKVDKTAPTLGAAISPAPNAYGWNRTNVTVSFFASDTWSGVDGASVTPDVTLTSEGPAQPVTGSAADLAGNTASITVFVSIDKTPPTLTGAATTSPNAAGWYNHNVTVHFSGFDALSGLALVTPDTTVSTEGAGQSLTGSAADLAGNSASVTVSGLSIDKTPPVTTISLSGTGSSGWYSGDVTVTLSAIDSGGSGTASTEYQLDGGAWTPYTAPFSIVSEGTHSLLYRSRDVAGNIEAANGEGGTVAIDKTPPTTSIGLAGTAGNNGWYRSEVGVTLTAADNPGGSGVDVVEYRVDGGGWTTYGATFFFSTEGVHDIHYRARDRAGTVEDERVQIVKMDWTPPVISATRAPEANGYGWNNTDVTVSFAVSDPLSGIDGSGPADVVVTAEGAGQSVTRSVVDLAGNTASATVSDISIDKTPPTISGAATTSPNVNGWYKADVTVHFTGSDLLSGVDTLTPDTVISTEGAGQSVEGTVTDRAGNSASVTVSGINLDKTPPAITAARTPEANGYGWSKTDVTVSFAVSDALSGVDGAGPADVVVTAEGAGQSVTRSVMDLAGNTASATMTDISIDKTPPAIEGAPTTSPNANGWYKDDVVVHFTGSDDLSGIASLTPDTVISTEGASQSVEGTVTDRAGNSANFTVTGINLDKTPPVITLTVPANGGAYLLHAQVTASWSVTDAVSGIEAATGTARNGDLLDTASPGDHGFQVEATDLAGNGAQKSVVYHVRYVYSGVLPPINVDGRSVFKLGSTVPVKVQLRDANGASVTNATATLYVAKLSNGVLGDELEAVSTAAATTGNLFRCDAAGSQYIFNLSTKPLSTGSWQMRISLDDGRSDLVLFSLR